MARPRIWVSGVLYVSDERELCAGRHVGYNGWGKAFSYAPVGHFGSLSDWRHRAWMIERRDLTPALVDEHALLLPERLLDADKQPHARRWLIEQPLLCVSGLKVDRLVDAGLRVYIVEHGVEADDFLRFEARGGERASWMVSGPRSAFVPEEEREAGEGLPASESRLVRGALDRVLRFVSRGVLTELGVVNALAARVLIDPGYGYRGATDGEPATIESVQRELRALEVLFGQIYKRARGQRDDAKRIVDAVQASDDNDAEIAVPVYGRAWRECLAETTVELSTDSDDELVPRWMLGDEPQAQLQLPAEPRFIVEEVALWNPKLPSELETELEAEARRTSQRPPAWLALALVGVLVVIIVLALANLH